MEFYSAVAQLVPFYLAGLALLARYVPHAAWLTPLAVVSAFVAVIVEPLCLAVLAGFLPDVFALRFFVWLAATVFVVAAIAGPLGAVLAPGHREDDAERP